MLNVQNQLKLHIYTYIFHVSIFLNSKPSPDTHIFHNLERWGWWGGGGGGGRGYK